MTPYVESDGVVAHGAVYAAAIHLDGTDLTELPASRSARRTIALLVEVAWPDDTADVIRLPAPYLA
ncbi:hypothetical protein ACWD5F_04825 [Streptomyces sp. NPDC002499]